MQNIQIEVQIVASDNARSGSPGLGPVSLDTARSLAIFRN